MLRTVLVMLGLLAAAAPAHAAEGFVAVLEDGRLVRFTSESTLSLSRPVHIRGLVQGERLIALGTGPSGLVAVGSSAQLYAISPDRRRAKPIGPPLPQGLRGSRFSLAVAPGGARARLLSDVGQDLVIDLRTGAAEPGPGLRRADGGDLIRPAVDLAADGRLVGWQLHPTTVFTETAPGASTMLGTRVSAPERVGSPNMTEPIAFQLGSNGRGYAIAVYTERLRARQSLLMTIDPATGELLHGYSAYQFFRRRLTTFASTGSAPDDRTAPHVQVVIRRGLSVRALLDRRLPLRVSSSEGCLATVRLDVVGGGRIATTGGTTDVPGLVRLSPVWGSRAERNRLRRSVGRQARLRVTVFDTKGNRRIVSRTVRLVR